MVSTTRPADLVQLADQARARPSRSASQAARDLLRLGQPGSFRRGRSRDEQLACSRRARRVGQGPHHGQADRARRSTLLDRDCRRRCARSRPAGQRGGHGPRFPRFGGSGLPDLDLTGSGAEVTDGLGLDFVLDEPQRGRGDRNSVAPTVETLAPTVESLAPTVESLAPTVESLAPTVESLAPTIESDVTQNAQELRFDPGSRPREPRPRNRAAERARGRQGR